MIKDIRDAIYQTLDENEGAGRDALMVILHPDTRRQLADLDGFDKNPDRISGVMVEYEDTVAEGEFAIVWKSEEHGVG